MKFSLNPGQNLKNDPGSKSLTLQLTHGPIIKALRYIYKLKIKYLILNKILI